MRIVLLSLLVVVLLATGFLFRAARMAPTPQGGGIAEGLAPCPETPNCVHLGADGSGDAPPFRLAPDVVVRAVSGPLLLEVESALGTLPRTRVAEVEVGGGFYLRAESRSRIFGFVDDLEVRWVQGEPHLEVRSAARTGRSDMGVNAARVESLRARLLAAGVLEVAPDA